jgi:hypothetical protein
MMAFGLWFCSGFFHGLNPGFAAWSIIFPFVQFQGVKGVSMCPAFFGWQTLKRFTARKYRISESDKRE